MKTTEKEASGVNEWMAMQLSRSYGRELQLELQVHWCSKVAWSVSELKFGGKRNALEKEIEVIFTSWRQKIF